jgi:hypothetical protein
MCNGRRFLQELQTQKEDLHPWHHEYRPVSASAQRSTRCSVQVSAFLAGSTDDKVRELQRTLYRSAKADPGRRFQVPYDKVDRRDVLAFI